MNVVQSDPSAVRVSAACSAVGDLGRWAAELEWHATPDAARERLRLVLFDTLAVTVLGAALPEQQALVSAWRPSSGPAPLIGTAMSTTVESAAHLNAVALVSLELDEGNKFAKGHPAAHGFPAVLALAAELDASGAETAEALLVAYEVAARFGRATQLRAVVHPHGNWGVTGAAAGCARLLGLSADGIAAAIDAGSALPVAGHFASALDGNPVRNSWMGASNTSGIAAARLAQAGLARNTGSAAWSLGELLGSFDATALTDELGQRWDITHGYFKRHSSCSYTHPAADAILALRDDIDIDQVREILIETHTLGAALDRTRWDSRLGAMFSTPFVVAAALLFGSVGPRESGERRDDRRLAEMAAKVRIVPAEDITARLPRERAVRVTVRAADRAPLVREVPNPVGDADHHPFDADQLAELMYGLLGDAAAVARLRKAAYALPSATSVRRVLSELGPGRTQTPSAS